MCVKQSIFEKKTLAEVGSSHLYASFGHLLRPNGPIIRGRVSLSKMLENDKRAVFEEKCHRFRRKMSLISNSFESLKDSLLVYFTFFVDQLSQGKTYNKYCRLCTFTYILKIS